MTEKDNATYQRILDASEKLFSARGYTAVTLQDIAHAVEMRHASLYYYAKNGKEQLYIAVTERTLRRHADGLTNAIFGAGDDIRAQLHAVAAWFAIHPPLDLGRMVRSDMPEINPVDAHRLMDLSLDTIRLPIAAMIRRAVQRGTIQVDDPDFAAMVLVGLLQSVHNVPDRFLNSRQALIAAMKSAADMLLFGWAVRA
jgi:AcrR family transcriptional regulator